MNGRTVETEVNEIVSLVLADYGSERDIDRINILDRPDKAKVIDMTVKLLRIVFPGYYRDRTYKFYDLRNSLSVLMEDVFYHMNQQIALALRLREAGGAPALPDPEGEALRRCGAFFRRIPEIRRLVETDLHATFDGDPAATCAEEIILAYPGIMATTIQRLAHELYRLEVPLIPRLMTEYAHSQTGIDIHPGASIGESICIDHGTGIVIGETSEIGKNVKIYQGVTIGALSTRAGQKLRGRKRHPTIEDNVTIYSGASVLGGETVIGANSVIGGNAFITCSIPPDTRVSIKLQELEFAPGPGAAPKTQELQQSEEWYDIV